MLPNEKGNPTVAFRSSRAAAPEDYIVRLMEEMADAAGGGPARDDADLDIVEERLAQLREQSSPAADDQPPGPAPAAQQAAAMPIAPVLPEIPVPRQRPAPAVAPSPRAKAGSVDAVILEAAAAGGYEAAPLAEAAPREPAPARRRRSLAGLYLLVLFVLAASGGLFARPLLDGALRALDANPAAEPAAIDLPQAAADGPALVVDPLATAGIEVADAPAPVWRTRKVKTYRVSADGKVDFGGTTAVD